MIKYREIKLSFDAFIFCLSVRGLQELSNETNTILQHDDHEKPLQSSHQQPMTTSELMKTSVSFMKYRSVMDVMFGATSGNIKN